MSELNAETTGYKVEFKIGNRQFDDISISPGEALGFTDELDGLGIEYTIRKGPYYYHKGMSPLSPVITKDELRKL